MIPTLVLSVLIIALIVLALPLLKDIFKDSTSTKAQDDEDKQHFHID